MRKLKISIDSYMEVKDSCDSKQEIIKEFFKRGYKPGLYDISIKIKSFSSELKLSLDENGELPPFHEMRSKVIPIIKESKYYSEYGVFDPVNDFILDTQCYSKILRCTPRKPPTYTEFKKICKLNRVDIIYDDEFQRKADKYDKEVIEEWDSDKNKEKRSEEHEK